MFLIFDVELNERCNILTFSIELVFRKCHSKNARIKTRKSNSKLVDGGFVIV